MPFEETEGQGCKIELRYLFFWQVLGCGLPPVRSIFESSVGIDRCCLCSKRHSVLFSTMAMASANGRQEYRGRVRFGFKSLAGL